MYNPELTHFLTIIVTTFISVFWAVCYMYGVCSKNVKPLTFSDKFDIGYIDDNKPDNSELIAVVNPNPPKTKIKSKAKKKKKEKEISQHDETFVRECVSALVGLGIKSAAAKRNVNDFLDKNPEVKTVEEFIEGIFKK